MRLIDVKTYSKLGIVQFKEFVSSDIPKYAIFSHRSSGGGVSYKDLESAEAYYRAKTSEKLGWKVLSRAMHFAAHHNYDWLWCFTTCVDYQSSAEISEAASAMYARYQRSEVCLVYLPDVSKEKGETFTQSDWFTRCWTLPELIAPNRVNFYDKDWILIGNKHSLHQELHDRTQIPVEVIAKTQEPLQGLLARYCVAQKISWAAGRRSTRPEDVAYSLLGLFSVQILVIYGEGDKAFERLQLEIARTTPDLSIFVWESTRKSTGLFAASPTDFQGCGDVELSDRFNNKPALAKAFTMTNCGLEISLEMRHLALHTYMAKLPVVWRAFPVYLVLEIDDDKGALYRTGYIRCQSKEIPACQEKAVTVLYSSTAIRHKTDSPIMFAIVWTTDFSVIEDCHLTKELHFER